jgi:hypothetical protein
LADKIFELYESLYRAGTPDLPVDPLNLYLLDVIRAFDGADPAVDSI